MPATQAPTACKLCGSQSLIPLPFELPEWEAEWRRCSDCGSDSSGFTYEQVRRLYDRTYIDAQYALAGSTERLRLELTENLNWFDDNAHLITDRTFLDVGCCEGTALDEMTERGWGVHGFDVIDLPYAGPHTTIAPFFHRWLFPRRYSGILCREVVEHVPNPHFLLRELWGAAMPGGLVQVQTPKPTDTYNATAYQTAHLFIISPPQLERMLRDAMLDVIDRKEWSLGQAYLARARR